MGEILPYLNANVSEVQLEEIIIINGLEDSNLLKLAEKSHARLYVFKNSNQSLKPEAGTFMANGDKTPISTLSNSSIGQHVRHILELYLAVFEAKNSHFINYDKRKRYTSVEQSPAKAIELLDIIIAFLSDNIEDRSLLLEGDFSNRDRQTIRMPTSLYRELAYNLEHSIHHQALIKIGYLGLNLGYLLHEDFGDAPATIRYRKEKSSRFSLGKV